MKKLHVQIVTILLIFSLCCNQKVTYAAEVINQTSGDALPVAVIPSTDKSFSEKSKAVIKEAAGVLFVIFSLIGKGFSGIGKGLSATKWLVENWKSIVLLILFLLVLAFIVLVATGKSQWIADAVYNSVKKLASTLRESFRAFAKAVKEEVEETYEDTKVGVGEGYKGAKVVAEDVHQGTRVVVQDLHKGGKVVLEETYEGLKEATKEGYEGLGTVKEDVKEGVQTVYEDTKEEIEGAHQAFQEVKEDVKEGVQTIYEKDIKEDVQDIYEGTERVVSDTYSGGRHAVKRLGTGLEVFGGDMSDLVQWFYEKPISGTLGKTGSAVVRIGTDLAPYFGAIMDAPNKLLESSFISGIFSILKSSSAIFSSLASPFYKKKNESVSGLISNFAKVMERLQKKKGRLLLISTRKIYNI